MIILSIPRKLAEQKPAYGSACNHCGICCRASTCGFGEKVLKLESRKGRPCPAYDAELGGCGLVLHPELYAPERTREHGAQALSDGAKLIMGAGVGCCMILEGENKSAAFEAKLFARTYRLRTLLDAAWALWGFR